MPTGRSTGSANCYPGASHCQLNNTSPSIRLSLYAYDLLNKASDPSTQQKFDLFNKATLVPQLIVKSRIINTFAISPSPFKYRSPPCALTIS
nr:hypothetical protein KV8917_710007 [Klebsiella variicola]